ncbi:phosphotransferase enzyme family protein, partial [Cobetia marina]
MAETSRISLLTMSENATFLAEDDEAGRRIIIRVHRPDYHCREEIESELAWIDDLRTTARINTPAPVMTTTGSPVLSISAGGQSLYVVAFEHVVGSEPDIGDDLPQWFERLGAMNATLHEHSRRW